MKTDPMWLEIIETIKRKEIEKSLRVISASICDLAFFETQGDGKHQIELVLKKR